MSNLYCGGCGESTHEFEIMCRHCGRVYEEPKPEPKVVNHSYWVILTGPHGVFPEGFPARLPAIRRALELDEEYCEYIISGQMGLVVLHARTGNVIQWR